MTALNQSDARAVAAGAPAVVRLFEPAAATYALGRRAQDPTRCGELARAVAAVGRDPITIVEVDRGGLGTLHAPGQIVAFFAVPCPRWGARQLCDEILSGIQELAHRNGRPATADLASDVGVWLDGGKLASLGLRLEDGVARHGVALNVGVDPALAAGLPLCGKTNVFMANLRDGGRPSPLDLRAIARQIAAIWHLGRRAGAGKKSAERAPQPETPRTLPHKAPTRVASACVPEVALLTSTVEGRPSASRAP